MQSGESWTEERVVVELFALSDDVPDGRRVRGVAGAADVPN